MTRADHAPGSHADMDGHRHGRRSPAGDRLAAADLPGDPPRPIPMAPGERRQWGERLTEIAQRWDGGELDLRDLHLELAALLRGFAEARSGEEITTATVSEILDMAATAGPRSVEERRRSVRQAGRPLDTNPLGHIGELLAVWEQPSFDREPQAAAQEALTHAREVITQW